MKKLTRVLSVVMAIAMLFTMSMSASAATYTDVTTEDSYYEAVEALSALGVVKGYDAGDFQPEGKITRAEAAAIIIRILGMASVENTRINTQFTDVTSEHWASGIISAAADSAIVNGMGDGTFAPSAEVTYDQVVKMLVCALGYEPKAKTVVAAGTNVFPTGYNIIANQLRITEGTAKTEGGATRATVARLVYNALTVPLMEQTSFGTDVKIEPVKDKSILFTKLNAVQINVAKIEDLELDPEVKTVKLTIKDGDLDDVAEENKWTSSKLDDVKKGSVDLAGLQGLSVKALVDISDSNEPVLLAVFPLSSKNTELVIDPKLFEDIETTEVSKDTYQLKYYKDSEATDTSKAKLEFPVAVFINKGAVASVGVSPAELNKLIGKAAKVQASTTNSKAYRFVDTDDDSAFDTLFIEESASHVVETVSNSTKKVTFKSDKKVFYSSSLNANKADVYKFTLKLDTENANLGYSIKDVEGNELAFEDIKVGDILTLAYSKSGDYEYYDITVSTASTVEGTVTELMTEASKIDSTDVIEYYEIDGKYYRLNGTGTSDKKIIPGSTGTFYLTADNQIIAFDVVAAARNYGVAIASGTKTDFLSTGVQVQMMTQDGTIKTFDYANEVTYYKGAGEGTVIDVTVDTNAETKDVYDADSRLTAIKNGEVVMYETNSDGKIKKIYLEADAIKKQFELTWASIAPDKDYTALTGKLDGKVLTEETVIIAVDSTANKGKENKYSLVSLDALTDETVYTGWLISNTDKEVEFAFITNLAVKPAFNSVPMVITGTSWTNVNGEERAKYTGLIGDETVSYVMAEEYTVVAMNGEVAAKVDAKKAAFGIEKNDVIQVVLNANNEIISYKHLLKYDADNSDYYAMIASAYDEEAKAAEAKLTKLSDQKAVEGCEVTAAPGAAVAGFPQTVAGRFVEFKTPALEDSISYSAAAPTFIYTVGSSKVKEASVLEAQTYKNEQADADDVVYIYSYDGENVFNFILDLNKKPE